MGHGSIQPTAVEANQSTPILSNLSVEAPVEEDSDSRSSSVDSEATVPYPHQDEDVRYLFSYFPSPEKGCFITSKPSAR